MMLALKDASKLLDADYTDCEAGYGLTTDKMLAVTASTYMPGVTAAMIDWWFGFVHTTDHYLLWHPRDHVFSDWEGPRNNTSTYIGGHHLSVEYVGGVLTENKISFKDPAEYFGRDWRSQFDAAGYGTAICARVGNWNRETGETTYIAHLIHLVKNEPDGCRMRSRFWLGDVEDLPEPVGDNLPLEFAEGLQKHATEEMAILASKLPALYEKNHKADAKL